MGLLVMQTVMALSTQMMFPFNSNETTDTDGDGMGDNTDTDDDGDGIIDVADADHPDNAGKPDADGDGMIDEHDPDDDNDGIPDIQDIDHPSNTNALDSDSDGIIDAYDTSDDRSPSYIWLGPYERSYTFNTSFRTDWDAAYVPELNFNSDETFDFNAQYYYSSTNAALRTQLPVRVPGRRTLMLLIMILMKI